MGRYPVRMSGRSLLSDSQRLVTTPSQWIHNGDDTMSYSKTIACLANSRKVSGRCVAGREVVDGRFGAWIRPVSERSSGEVSEEERRYENGEDLKIFDLVRICFLRHEPYLHQQENHVIDDKYYWGHMGRVTWSDIQGAIDNPEQLWENQSNSYNGKNDRVDVDRVNLLTSSLYLIQPENLRVTVAAEGGGVGPSKPKVRVRFQYHDVEYRLAVTDPVVERHCLAVGQEVTPVSNSLLCVSLGEPFQGYVYKLAVAVITPKRGGS